MSGPDSFRAARANDDEAIDALLRAAFGGAGEAALMRRLRAEGLVDTEVVMVWGGQVVAHLALSRLTAPAGWLALAPVSVAPEWQGRRLGSRLLAGVMKLAAIRRQAVVVVGKPSFYSRAGFRFGTGMSAPYPPEVVGVFGGEAADVVYPEAFGGI